MNSLRKKPVVRSANRTCRGPELSLPATPVPWDPVPSFHPIHTLHNNLMQMQAEATKWML